MTHLTERRSPVEEISILVAEAKHWNTKASEAFKKGDLTTAKQCWERYKYCLKCSDDILIFM